MRNERLAFCFLLTCALLAPAAAARAQERFQTGQNVAPIFEGWQKNADGSISMWFGYLNRNYEEQLDVPVGATNFFEPGPQDRGQPTHFMTRRNRFLFKVIVPKDWDAKRRVIWTLTTAGKTEKAQGWLQPEWEVDYGVIQMNIGPGGAPPTNPPNTAPTITGSAAQSSAVADTLILSAKATDDGVPKPRPGGRGAAAARGPSIRWIHYRGAGKVTFGSPAANAKYGEAAESTTTVKFSAPGTYVLRAIASDGLLEGMHDVTVTVK